MSKLRKFRRLSLLPLMAWLLMQFATASVFMQRADAAFPAESIAAAGIFSTDAVVICTPRGLVIIGLDSEGKELPADPGFFPGCQWCQPFGNDAAIAGPEQSGLRLPTLDSCRYKPDNTLVVSRDDIAEAFRSRAPPL